MQKPNRVPFVLPRKAYGQTDRWPRVRVKQETYDIITAMASQSGLSLSDVVGRAVRYAAENLEYVEE